MKKILNATIRIIVFNDNSGEDCCIASYCPELNLLGYGNTEKESIKELECIMNEHFEYVLENNTMNVDLIHNKWSILDGKYIPPTHDYMMKDNEIYRDIITTKKYETIYRVC